MQANIISQEAAVIPPILSINTGLPVADDFDVTSWSCRDTSSKAIKQQGS